ncbi:hypothetical protein [Halorhodospira halochloris]|uniref:hypothetical protein n=1 Tax=Halorhodospira halochloris TaxID=1052 RepID=UPI001EE92402|nr:hypothetical protein [Halorhodospira halochloris]MCG5548416.1 hypothetical protein [Halorhodospira halochloris]
MNKHSSILYNEWQRAMRNSDQSHLSHYRLAAQAIRQGLGSNRSIWIAGNVHKRETKTIIETFILLRNWHTNLLLVLNPANTEDWGELYSHCRHAGLKVGRHSAGVGCTPCRDVYILDTSEEIGLFYLASDAAFIGSSLVHSGYPDPTLAARAGLPAVSGPYIDYLYNEPRLSRLTARLIRIGSIRRGNNAVELADALHGLLVDGQLGKALGECARRAACRARSSRLSLKDNDDNSLVNSGGQPSGQQRGQFELCQLGSAA